MRLIRAQASSESQVFVGLGKTVLMGVVYPIWRIIKGERYVIHTAADVDLAQERTAFTLHELQNNKRLTMDYPELQQWMPLISTSISRTKPGSEPEASSRAIEELSIPDCQAAGLIVCDDIDKEENMGNQSIGKRRMEKITQELAGGTPLSGG
jgi:hypothetical protein